MPRLEGVRQRPKHSCTESAKHEGRRILEGEHNYCDSPAPAAAETAGLHYACGRGVIRQATTTDVYDQSEELTSDSRARKKYLFYLCHMHIVSGRGSRGMGGICVSSEEPEAAEEDLESAWIFREGIKRVLLRASAVQKSAEKERPAVSTGRTSAKLPKLELPTT